MSTSANSSPQSVATAALNATPNVSFPARGGTFGGPFRVDGKRCLMLPGQCQVTMTDSGVTIEGKYDPPGSGLYAFLATIGSVVLVVAMLQAFNVAAAPGWLVWYLLIVAIRRRSVTFALADASEIVVDQASSRIAFETEFQEKTRWFAVELQDGFERVEALLRQIAKDRLQQRTVCSASSTPVIILIGLILAAIAAVVFFVINPIG